MADTPFPLPMRPTYPAPAPSGGGNVAQPIYMPALPPGATPPPAPYGTHIVYGGTPEQVASTAARAMPVLQQYINGPMPPPVAAGYGGGNGYDPLGGGIGQYLQGMQSSFLDALKSQQDASSQALGTFTTAASGWMLPGDQYGSAVSTGYPQTPRAPQGYQGQGGWQGQPMDQWGGPWGNRNPWAPS